MKQKLTIFVIWALMLLSLSGCGFVTVVPLGEENTAQFYYEDTEFDVAGYVRGIWPQVVEFTAENAKPMSEVRAAFKQDKEGCRAQYGFKQPTEGAGYNYIVTDTVMVLEINTQSKAGQIRVDEAPYDGVSDYILQCGAVFKGSAIRDAMPFIAFGDFRNQMSYGDVGKQLNTEVYDAVISLVDMESLAGKEITYIGVYAESDEPQVMPTSITVEG